MTDHPEPDRRDLYGRRAAADIRPRCHRCTKMLALYLTQPWLVTCPRCKAANCRGGDVQVILDKVNADAAEKAGGGPPPQQRRMP